MLEAGHSVLTAHLARPEVMRAERVVDPGEVYQRDIAWIEECQALVAEVSTPSHGVGYEIAWALGLLKPVLCIYRHDARVSKMITGNDSPTLRLATYTTREEAVAVLGGYLKGIAP
jgi:nucleoside 2-deoxyribosyltransferase